MRDTFVEWCRSSGFPVSVDKMGCIFARRDGAEDLPPILIGSHLDTQVNGGRFDGICGVLAGLEVLRRLDDLGITTRRPIEVVNWTNEEGARFSPPMIASGVFAGTYDLDWAYGRADDEGATLGDELDRIGYKGTRDQSERAIDSYFELHIEQGDELYTSGRQVGVVTHAYRSHGMLVEFAGETAHTGPWPMAKRRNALVAASRFLVAVDDIGWSHAETGGKGTAAQLYAWPNRAGSLSDWAQAVCDVRHDDPQVASAMRDQMRAAAQSASVKASCDLKILDEWTYGGDIFDQPMIDAIRDCATQSGYSTLDLPAQAGHDAYYLASKCPTAMIFTPCKDGITHNNNELATREHLEPALNVLLNAVFTRAGQA
jgi:N-carbamoyl-L-amino-acid hydrolase